MRACTDSDCRGDCTWCNRADLENPALPARSVEISECRDALCRSLTALRHATGPVPAEDARRVLSALESALDELQKLRPEPRRDTAPHLHH